MVISFIFLLAFWFWVLRNFPLGFFSLKYLWSSWLLFINWQTFLFEILSCAQIGFPKQHCLREAVGNLLASGMHAIFYHPSSREEQLTDSATKYNLTRCRCIGLQSKRNKRGGGGELKQLWIILMVTTALLIFTKLRHQVSRWLAGCADHHSMAAVQPYRWRSTQEASAPTTAIQHRSLSKEGGTRLGSVDDLRCGISGDNTLCDGYQYPGRSVWLDKIVTSCFYGCALRGRNCPALP